MAKRLKTTQVSVNRWMGKQNALHMCNRVLLSLKKEQNPDTCYNMDGLWKYYEPDTEQILYDSNYMKYLE